MLKDRDLVHYKNIIKHTKQVFPYHYFLTTKWDSWDIEQRVGCSLDLLALNDAKVLARRSKSHIYPIIGVEFDKKRNCHYHMLILSEKEHLNIDALNKWDDGRDMHLTPYDDRQDGLSYVVRKHLPVYVSEVIHPRRKVGCNCNACNFSRVLKDAMRK